MDPDATLERIRELIPLLDGPRKPDDVDDLLNHVEALDNWLSRGGFMPSAWTPFPKEDA